MSSPSRSVFTATRYVRERLELRAVANVLSVDDGDVEPGARRRYALPDTLRHVLVDGTMIRPTRCAYATAASFRHVDVLPIEHDFWHFYPLVPRRVALPTTQRIR